MAGDNCRCHSKPPLRVRRIAPSLPTAQPVFLSAANLTELIGLPCGSGFCHSQPEGCGCCACGEGANSKSSKMQLSKLATRPRVVLKIGTVFRDGKDMRTAIMGAL